MSRRLLMVFAAVSVLSACAATTGLTSLGEFQDRQAAAAAAAEQDGKLREALNLWHTVLTVEPKNASAVAAAEALELSIARDTRRAISRGNAAYAKGNNREGDRWMLRALALTPGEDTAFAALQLSVSDASHRRQKEKVESSYPGVLEESADENGKNGAKAKAETQVATDPRSEAQRLFEASDYEGAIRVAGSGITEDEADAVWVRDAHLVLAERAQKAGELEQQLMHLDAALALSSPPDEVLAKKRKGLAKSLSDLYYRRSLSLIKSDVDGAIASLEAAVAFNPSNIAATDKLDQAKTLKRNLSRIKAR